jgi:hypothetical protein
VVLLKKSSPKWNLSCEFHPSVILTHLKRGKWALRWVLQFLHPIVYSTSPFNRTQENQNFWQKNNAKRNEKNSIFVIVILATWTIEETLLFFSGSLFFHHSILKFSFDVIILWKSNASHHTTHFSPYVLHIHVLLSLSFQTLFVIICLKYSKVVS